MWSEMNNKSRDGLSLRAPTRYYAGERYKGERVMDFQLSDEQ
jgi:hypothetical protein